MPTDPLLRLRQLCLAFPEGTEKVAWGAPTFRAKDKLFAMYASADSHHGSGRPADTSSPPRFGKRRPLSTGAMTVRTMLHLVMEDGAYHGGQITLLTKAVSARQCP